MNTISLNSISLDGNIIRKGNGGGGNVSTNSFARLAEIGYTNEEIKSVENQFYDELEYSQALLDTWDVHIEDASFYYQENYWVKYLPLIDTSNVTSMDGMFVRCISLTSIPQLNTSNVTSMSSMFGGCTSLTYISQLDTSNVEYMNEMFAGCSALTTIPQLDTSNVVDMSYMFQNFIQVGPMSLVDNYKDFQTGAALTYIPQLDTSKVKYMYEMFSGCASLTHIASIDMSSVEDTEYIFSYCNALVFALIKNIGKSSATTFDFEGAVVWGTGSNENRQSLIDSLITYSYDRASNGLSSATIKLSSTTKALLTQAEIAQITAKGFTIS